MIWVILESRSVLQSLSTNAVFAWRSPLGSKRWWSFVHLRIIHSRISFGIRQQQHLICISGSGGKPADIAVPLLSCVDLSQGPHHKTNTLTTVAPFHAVPYCRQSLAGNKAGHHAHSRLHMFQFLVFNLLPHFTMIPIAIATWFLLPPVAMAMGTKYTYNNSIGWLSHGNTLILLQGAPNWYRYS